MSGGKHGGFDVQVGVNQPGQNNTSMHIFGISGLVIANAQDAAIAYGQVSVNDPAGKNIHDSGVGEQQIRLFPACGHVQEIGGELFGVHSLACLDFEGKCKNSRILISLGSKASLVTVFCTPGLYFLQEFALRTVKLGNA
jgi:hypothetical protein